MNDASERVLVLAPFGRDAVALATVIERASLEAFVCADLEALDAATRVGAGALVLTDHALVPRVVSSLVAMMAVQPTWSDLPVLLLAQQASAVAGNVASRRVAQLRGAMNITVIERPLRAAFFTAAIEAALKNRRRQYELRAALARAEDARREAEAASQAKDDFLATVSHELRVPIGAILLWSGILRRDLAGGVAARRAVEAIDESARGQAKLIDDLLEISRMVAGKLELVIEEATISSIIDSAVTIVDAAASAKMITIELDVPAEQAPVRLDPDRIQQVLVNLLANAIKFTPAGGAVRVRARLRPEAVSVEVSDTGMGIEPALLAHVFERFRQGDAAGQNLHGGLGLGLAICRQLVELHGGTITASSKGRDQGATFLVELPVASGSRHLSSERARGARLPVPVGQLVGDRVLLVEDDRATREAIALILESHGAHVVAVGDGEAALARVTNALAEEHPHVLLTDLGLPGMDGLELLRRLRLLEGTRSLGPMSAVMLTAYARVAEAERAREAGLAQHLQKPIDPDVLVATLTRLAHRGRPG